MRDVAEIRRENLSQLIRECGGPHKGQAELARLAEKDRRQVSAWAKPPGTPGAKNMSSAVARHLERVCGKPPYWMDHDTAEQSQNLHHESPITSHPQRTDRTKMRDAMEVLKHLAELHAAPELVNDPDAIAIAYDFLVEFDTPLTDSNVLDITKRIAEKLRGEAANAGSERSKTA